MKRHAKQALLEWKEQEERTPLIIRGARQVGKSYLVEEFGRQHFDHILTVNFEELPEACSCFEVLNVQTIIKKLNFLFKEPLLPGKTLLFLDEIQICPNAIRSLRYFHEKLPGLHVIAASSLLEFVLEDEEEPLAFPVGRVRFLNMKPLSFLEFLEALGQKQWIEAIQTATDRDPISQDFHNLLMRFVRDYYLIGGMPKAILSYTKNNSYLEAIRTQTALLDLYRLDLGKYGKKKEFPYLQRLFEKAPLFVAQHFRYSKIDPESSNPARTYKESLHKLDLAGLITPIHATAANGLPLRSEENEKKFKLLFLDIGLLQCALGVDPESFITSASIHEGVLAEQFVGQEMITYVDPYLQRRLFFWDRQKTGGSAEVDYVVNLQTQIVPIEVKAGKTGRLRSLKQFLETKPAKLGVQISDSILKLESNILTVPFYMVSQLERLIKISS